MAKLSNINNLFAVEDTGAIKFNDLAGTTGQILKSNGTTGVSPTWVNASTVIGGPYVQISGDTMTGPLTINGSNSLTVGGIGSFNYGTSTTDNVRFYNADGSYAYIRVTADSNNANTWFDTKLGATLWYAWGNSGGTGVTNHWFGTGTATTASSVKIDSGDIYQYNSSAAITNTLNAVGGATFAGNVEIFDANGLWLYSTPTTTNYELFALDKVSAGNARLRVYKSGTGSYRGLEIQTGGSATLTLDASQAATFTGIITAPGGTSTEWNTAYDDSITGLTVTGTTTKTLTATRQVSADLTASWTDNDSGGTVTGTGVANKVAYWTSATNIDDGPITFATNDSTFAGYAQFAQFITMSSTQAQYGYLNLGAASVYGWQIGKGPSSGGIVGNESFYLYNFSNSSVALEVDTSNNATFSGATFKVNNNADPTIICVDADDTNYGSYMKYDTTSNVMRLFPRYAGTYYTDNLVLDRGSVGIGYASPSYTLDVNGTGRFYNKLYAYSLDTLLVPNSTWAYLLTTSTASGNNHSGFWINSDGSPDMRLRRLDGTVRTLFNSNTSDSYINNGGSLGIGNNAPGYKLDVTGNIRSSTVTVYDGMGGSETGIGASAAGGYLRLYTAGVNRVTVQSTNETMALYGNTTTGSNYMSFKNSAGTQQGYLGYGSSGTNTLYLVQQSSDDIAFYNGGATRMTINTTGQAEFFYQLKFKNAWNSGALYGNSFYVQDATDGFAMGVGTGISSWFSWSNTAGQKRAIDLDNDGNYILVGAGDQDVQINGTTSPLAPLSVDNNAIRMGRDWAIANRAIIRMDSNGPSYPTDLLYGHTAAANQSGWDGVYWSLSSRGSGADGKFYFYRGAGQDSPYNGEAVIMTFTRDLKVGINDQTPSYALDVTGDIRATADVIAYSDARVKDNIKTIDNALEKTTKLRGVSYTRKDIDDKSTKIGVIAQEVIDVLPEVVSQDDDGKYSVAYGNMVGILIEAIKELEARVKELENK